MSQTLGFVGLGRMGSGMVRHLQKSGLPVWVYDANPAVAATIEGAHVASSLRELGETADTVFLSLPDASIVKAVLFGADGLLSGAHKVRVVADFSTIGPNASIEIAETLSSLNVEWLEAPVSGGPKGAANGTLAVMLSGRKDVLEKMLPLVERIGKVFIAGETFGAAQTAKLANNMLSSAAIVLTSEVMAMGAKAGVDANVLLDIINAGSGRNSATVDKFPRAVVTRTFDYGFATGLAYKDIRLCVDESQALGAPMVLGALVCQMLAATNAKYGPNSDFTEVARIYEDWAGVEITGK